MTPSSTPELELTESGIRGTENQNRNQITHLLKQNGLRNLLERNNKVGLSCHPDLPSAWRLLGPAKRKQETWRGDRRPMSPKTG